MVLHTVTSLMASIKLLIEKACPTVYIVSELTPSLKKFKELK